VGTDAGGVWNGVAALVGIMFSMNLVLACLNVIPLPPLDGSAAVALLMSESTANKYQMLLWGNPMLGLAGMLLAWRAFDAIFYPIFWTVVAVIYPGANYS
jgi:Zn-dependent protease